MDAAKNKRKAAERKAERQRIGAIKGTKPERDVEYLKFIRLQPCLVCGLPSEAAHTGIRGMRQKASDYEAIPLCRTHHRREYPESHHTLGKRFFEHHGIERDAAVRLMQMRYLGQVCIESPPRTS